MKKLDKISDWESFQQPFRSLLQVSFSSSKLIPLGHEKGPETLDNRRNKKQIAVLKLEYNKVVYSAASILWGLGRGSNVILVSALNTEIKWRDNLPTDQHDLKSRMHTAFDIIPIAKPQK